MIPQLRAIFQPPDTPDGLPPIRKELLNGKVSRDLIRLIGNLPRKGPVMPIEGYAALWNKPDEHGEIFLPGSFRETLRQSRNGAGVAMLFKHNWGIVVGRWHRIVEDDYGLYVDGEIDAGLGKGVEDIGLAAERGEFDGLSIGFRTVATDKRGRIIETRLSEISLLEDPAQDLARFNLHDHVRP